MLNTELELELELLQLESSLLIEDGDNEKSKDNIVAKLKAFFTKIFKWIGGVISTLKNKVVARFVDIEKAYKKHFVGGNPTLEFKGAKWLEKIDDVIDTLDGNVANISMTNDLESLEEIERFLKNKLTLTVNIDLIDKVDRIDVNTLGDAVRKFSNVHKNIDEATKAYKNIAKEAKSALRELERDSEEEHNAIIAKKKANILKKILGMYQSEFNRMSYILIAGITAMKKVGKVKVSKDAPNNVRNHEPKTESSFLEDSMLIESELDKLLNEDTDSLYDLEMEYNQFFIENTMNIENDDFAFRSLNEDFQDEEDIDSILDSLIEF